MAKTDVAPWDEYLRELTKFCVTYHKRPFSRIETGYTCWAHLGGVNETNDLKKKKKEKCRDLKNRVIQAILYAKPFLFST